MRLIEIFAFALLNKGYNASSFITNYFLIIMKCCVKTFSVEAKMYFLWYVQGRCASKRHRVACSFFILYLE